MVNKVTLIGHLGKDPEIRRLENGIAVAKFSVATSESYKDKSGEWVSQTEWHTIIAWRLHAERAEQQLKKGSLVYIEGKLTHRKWQDAEGKDRYNTEVVANYFRSLDKRENSGTGYTSNFPGADQAPPAKPFEASNTTAEIQAVEASATTATQAVEASATTATQAVEASTATATKPVEASTATATKPVEASTKTPAAQPAAEAPAEDDLPF